jgi:hypothetical protein
MLNVKNLSTISFGQLNFHKNGDRLVFDDFTCKDSNNEDCFVKSEKDILDNFKETVKIYPSKNSKYHVAENKNHFYNEIKQIYDDNMETFVPSHYKKGYGSIMHLCNIMELIENNYDEIIFSSFRKAIYFHSKLKFEPKIKKLEDIKKHLQKDILDKDLPEDMQPFKEKALKIIQNENSPQENLIRSGNSLINDFIQTVIKKGLDRDKYGIFEGFTMHLTKEKILNNKEFYNKLFNTFHIDYLIK